MDSEVTYFAYGSNMLSKQMKNRCSSFKKIGIGFLRDWEFEYDGGEKEDWEDKPVGNIVKSPGAEVWGVLYKIGTKELKQLDMFEHVPRDYYHIKVTVIDKNDNLVRAIAYSRLPKKIGNPSEKYLKTVIEGAIENKLPNGYIEKYLQI